MTVQEFKEHLLEKGAYKVGEVTVSDIKFDPIYRTYCEANSCGNYGRNWTCPPDAGDIYDLIAQAKCFNKAIVYQTVGKLEDSYDFEGMQEVGKLHHKLIDEARKTFELVSYNKKLHLGAGGCHECSICAKQTDEPCRFPDKALCSLETYGIGVSTLAKLAGMNYINGKDTVTYFAAVLYTE